MMTFTRQDVAAWLRFSGDANPLHYDEQKARQAGFSNPTVPGMLLVMPIKQLAFEHSATGQIQLFFKRPVFVDTPYHVQKEKEGVQLRSPSEDAPAVTGRLLTAAPNLRLPQYQHTSTMTCAELEGAWEGYGFSTAVPALLMEALMFRNLLQHLKAMVLGEKSYQDMLSSGTMFHLSNSLSIRQPITDLPKETVVHFSVSQTGFPLPGWLGHLRYRGETACGNVLSEHLFGVKA